MRRLRVVMSVVTAMAAVAATGALAAATPAANGGSFTKHVYQSTAGNRVYWLYTPPGRVRQPRPMVVFLHGCLEAATDAAQATHFDELAAQRGFVVVYPQQNVPVDSSAPVSDGNGAGCWNWFLPEDMQRGTGEPAVLAGLTQEVAAAQHVDRRRIYVEGISAGADMAVILGATYPDVYAAVGVLAGCAYAGCSDETGTLTHQAMGAHARAVPMFIENGSADTLNNMGMASTAVASWLGADRLAGDPLSANAPQTFGADQTPAPGSGDACVHNDSWTCPGGVAGFQRTYPYTVTSFSDARGCDLLQFWVIHGMEHAHPDASGDGPYTDPLGPDVTTASYDFFSNYTVDGGCDRT